MQDLGSLGSREGPQVLYSWVPTSILPALIPYFVLLGMLSLKRNRSVGAWWIWTAVGWGFALQALLRAAPAFWTGQPLEQFAVVTGPLTFGLACLWLTAGTHERRSRLKTFFFVAVVVSGLGIGAYLLRLAADRSYEMVVEWALLVMCALIIPVSFSSAGLFCRRRYRPAGLLLWNFACAIGCSLLVVMPFMLYALSAGGGNVLWREFFIGMALLAIINFAILLPFLLLAICNRLYRDRVKSLLRLDGDARPTLLAPLPERAVEVEVR